MRYDTKLRTYVRYFLSDGSYRDEEVIERCFHNQSMPEGTYCYVYYDTRPEVLNDRGRPTVFNAEPRAWSPMYYCSGVVYIMSEAIPLAKYDRELEQLLKLVNQRGHQAVDRVLRQNGTWYALRREDVVREIHKAVAVSTNPE